MVIQLWSFTDWTNLPQTGSLGQTRHCCHQRSLTPARRLRFWQPLLLIQVTGSLLYPSVPVGCVWTTRQFVLLWLCVPHSFSCGENVDAWGQHAFVCKHASGRTQRHHALNDVIARSFASAGIPVAKEPTGIYRDSVKRPDGVTVVLLQSDRALNWDVTVTNTLAESYLPYSLFRHCSRCS